MSPRCHSLEFITAGLKNFQASLQCPKLRKQKKMRDRSLILTENCDLKDFLRISFGLFGTVRDRIQFPKMFFSYLNHRSALSYSATPWHIIYAFSDFWSRGPANNLFLKSRFSLRTGLPGEPFWRESVEKVAHSNVVKCWFIKLRYKEGKQSLCFLKFGCLTFWP